MTLHGYIIRRLVLTALTLCGVVLAVFLMTHLLPGNPALVKLGGYATPERLAALEKEMGLDKPMPVQLVDYAWKLVHGNLGNSQRTGHPVLEDIRQRFPATVELAVSAFLLSVIVGLPLGILAAVKRDSLLDRIVQIIAVAGASTPLFWFGLVLIFVFYHILSWAPAPVGRIDMSISPPPTITGMISVDSLLTGNFEAFFSVLKHMALPGFSLALVELAPLMKMARSAMLDALQADYVQGARALGLSTRRIVLQDALKNTMIVILTMLGISLGYLLAGNVVVETIFAWPGIGLYAWTSLMGNDYDAIQGFVLTIGVVYLLLNLVIDLLYCVIDPRIRLGGSR